MNKPKLFLDFDGTVVDSISAYYQVYYDKYKDHKDFKSINPNNCIKWDLSDIAPLAKDNIQDIFSNCLFFYYLKPFPNVIEILQKLKEKYQIIIVSIGTYDNISNKCIYINENFSFIDDFIGIVNKDIKMDKSCINMNESNDNPNIFIDDNADNLLSVQYPNLIRYCYGDKRTEWNSKWLDIKGRQLRNWLEVEKELIK